VRRPLRLCAALACAALCAPGGARAHAFAPALLDVQELGGGRARVLWRSSALRAPGSDPRPSLPASCQPLGAPEERVEGGTFESRFEIQCPGELAGLRFGAHDLERARIDALARVALADGRVVQRVLRPGAASFVVPERESARAILRAYLALGVEHILLGADHLLFVFGLLLLVGRAPRALVATISGFTLGHSVTLSLAALGALRAPTRAVELWIALSVFLLALELARPPAPRPALLRRRPWAMATAFGLLHGLGFAGALAEAGLPASDVPVALLSFNAGIELGQLAFVGAVLLGWSLLAARLARLPRWTRALPVYALGALSAYWCLERAAQLAQLTP
jgi:hypothetical protein